MCANYSQNRLVTNSVPCTPYKRWEGSTKPNKLWLCFIPRVKRMKFDNESKLLTFMGYDIESSGLRFVFELTFVHEMCW